MNYVITYVFYSLVVLTAVLTIVLTAVLTIGHIDVGTSVDDVLQLLQVVEPLAKAYDPSGQGVHGSNPVLE